MKVTDQFHLLLNYLLQNIVKYPIKHNLKLFKKKIKNIIQYK